MHRKRDATADHGVKILAHNRGDGAASASCTAVWKRRRNCAHSSQRACADCVESIWTGQSANSGWACVPPPRPEVTWPPPVGPSGAWVTHALLPSSFAHEVADPPFGVPASPQAVAYGARSCYCRPETLTRTTSSGAILPVAPN